ncbi:hypothetical protein [Ralstonia mannitolilytica]|uniref:hypothetical protein n=1 Tax=Ralstonia mannitolilytica TaxID=105219 RepID=UPI003B8C27E7
MAQHSAGRISVNQAAGTGNAQANLATLSTDQANVMSSQSIVSARAGASAASSITGAAFNSTSGLISINQTSGSANAQVNVVAIAPTASIVQRQVRHIEPLADTTLSDVAAQGRRQDTSPATDGRQDASIASTALRNSSGVVQVNQTAGTGNVTSNTFVLRPPAGTLF